MKRLAILFFFQSCLLLAMSQEGDELKVIDAVTGDAVSQAQVQFNCPECAHKKSNLIFTNDKGIAKIPSQKVEIAFVSHLGYYSTEVTLKENSNLVKLEPNVEQLDDVVVTAQYKPENPENLWSKC